MELDDLLAIGAGFDWISPAAGVLGDLINGPGYTFLITWDSLPGMSGAEVEWVLRRRGVGTWGAMIVANTLMISVRLNQAQYAQSILDQAGVQVENPIGPAGGAGRRGPAAAGQRQAAPARRRAEVAARSEILQRHARNRAAVLARHKRGRQ